MVLNIPDIALFSQKDAWFFQGTKIKTLRGGHNYAEKTLMLSNNVWSVSEERSEETKEGEKASAVQRPFCEINPAKGDQEEFQLLFPPDSLALSRKLSHYPISYFLSLFLFHPFPSHCFWKTFLIKNPARDLDLSVGSAGRQIPTASAGSEGTTLRFLSSLFLPQLFLPSTWRCWNLHRSSTHSSRKRDREKPTAALPFQRANDADRDLKAAFSAKEKRRPTA